ncbi:hypothetical protein BJF90_26960 [Pseudonocardia sp. CNS-004]|nr:hypothetical protein BJF90_26960 [Pseudonocardia sp. CNS-004]
MHALGLSPDIIDVPDPDGRLDEPCIVRGSAGASARTLYFHGHFDVVPAQDRRQFTAERRDGRIIGRGTADMKGGIVSMLYGAAARGSWACWARAGSCCTWCATRRPAASRAPDTCAAPA